MAFPKNLASIATNLTPKELAEVVKAIENGKTTNVRGSDSLFAESRGWKFKYKGSVFEASEDCEMVYAIRRI